MALDWDDGLVLVIFVVIILFAGSLAGIVSLFRFRELRRRFDTLEKRFEQFNNLVQANVSPAMSTVAPEPEPDDDSIESDRIEEQNDPWALAPAVAPMTESTGLEVNLPQAARWKILLRDNWMIALGGFCVALAGIFLVRYSMEQGLLGPKARVAAGGLTGFALHGVALWLARRSGQMHGSLSALAGAGSITLYAAVLAALRLYDLIPVNLGFVLLSVTALATMWLALYYGPALTAIGILGAYIVPLLLGSHAEPSAILLIYSGLVTCSALGVLRYVYRNWLWFGMLLGLLTWWGIFWIETGFSSWLAAYLAFIAYAMLAIPSCDWWLQQPFRYQQQVFPIRQHFRELIGWDQSPRGVRVLSLVLMFLASGMTLWAVPEKSPNLMVLFALFVVLLLASLKREDLSLLPWGLLLIHAMAVLLRHLQWDPQGLALERMTFDESLPWWACWGVMALLLSLVAGVNYCRQRAGVIWASLLCIAPLVLFCLAYLVSHQELMAGVWCVIALAFGLVYLGLARQFYQQKRYFILDVWLFIAGHLAYSAAVAIYLNEVSFTLAMALQLISISWVVRRFELPEMAWLLKCVATVVIVRVTLHPWLFEPSLTLSWLLLGFGGGALSAVVSAVLLHPYERLRIWMEGVAAHLLVLTIWSLSRYFLYHGEVFAEEYSATEAAINLCLSGALVLVYYQRSLLSEYLNRFYQLYGYFLLLVAIVNYLLLLTALVLSERWLWMDIGPQPLANLLLLAFGGPVLLSLAGIRFYRQKWRRGAAILAGVSGFLFVSIEIRHLWQQSIRLDIGMMQAELYTYSAVWLAVAVVAILWGSQRFGPICYRGGLALLAAVILKLFLVDMAGLEGLLRVASFMGLGLCLLGVAYLHRKLQLTPTE